MSLVSEMEDTSVEISEESDDTSETENPEENASLVSGDSNMDSSELTPYSKNKSNIPADSSKKVLDANHPLMIKYQQDLKERLLKLLQETDEQLLDLKRTISAQEKENDHFAKQGYEFQKELRLQEEKLTKIEKKYNELVGRKQNLQEKCEVMRQSFQNVEGTLENERKMDVEYQRTLEDIAFQVVQLTSLQAETFTDAKSLQRAVEKTTKDRENLELQKLRQDLLIFRLENDKYNLEDKINLYKTQWAIKKEEVADLRKELNAAHTEMEIINYEKQQIVQQWRQSLSSLEKQDRVLSEIRSTVRTFEDDLQTLNMEITSHKKSVRKELERNELLTVNLHFRESDIARSQRELKDISEKQNDLLENLSVMEKVIEITENELNFLNDRELENNSEKQNNLLENLSVIEKVIEMKMSLNLNDLSSKIIKEKELEAKERDIQKCFNLQKGLEEKHMDVLHQKITITKASKYTEKIIKEIRNSISVNEDKGSKKESEKQKLLLQVDNLKTYLNRLETNIEELQKENKQRGILLDKSEANVVKTREKMDTRRNEYKVLENELQEMINRAGGQELAPFERELANLRKEIYTAEQGKRDMEQEYLRFQRELFSMSKQNAVSNEENDMYKKRIVIMEGKKFQLEADIAKEEKDIKDTQNRIHYVDRDIAHITKLLNERKELQDCLKQASDMCKSDFSQTLKEAELNFLQKQAELNDLRKKKRKFFSKLIEIQKYIIFWEQKVHLAVETRRVLKSEAHLNALFQIRSEIRRLQVKQEQIKKEQENLVQEMGKAVYRHTNLYVEADKQALFGKRRKTPEYVKKRIKNNMRKLVQDKKALESSSKELEALKITESQLKEAVADEESRLSEMFHKIKAIELNTDMKLKEKRQAVIRLSFKQKKSKFLQKVKDGSYIRAVRNEERRPEEIKKLQNGLRAVQVIIQAAINEYPGLIEDLSKAFDYIIVSKEF